MILSKLTESTEDFLYMERYVNIGSPSGFTNLNTTSSETCPQGDCTSFYLCSIEVPDSIQIREYGDQPDFLTKWQMLVHPDLISDKIFDICTKIEHMALCVAPTSSARTVKILDSNDWFLKLNYRGLIGRIDRQLSEVHAISAIEVSKAVTSAIDDQHLPNFFGILRDIYGRVLALPNGGSEYQWGLVAREPIPYGLDDRVSILVPAFSLFSPDNKNPKDPTILIQLIESQDKNPEDFLFEEIISPLYESYFSLLLHLGLQIEAHAQNILFALDKEKKLIGVVVRDAESIDKDFSLMEEIGIDNPFSDIAYKKLVREDYNYQIMHSFMFDFKMGEYLTKPIIQHAAKRYLFDKDLLVERIKYHNAKFIDQLPRDFFPDNWYSYKNIVHDRTSRRPYISHRLPRYR